MAWSDPECNPKFSLLPYLQGMFVHEYLWYSIILRFAADSSSWLGAMWELSRNLFGSEHLLKDL